MESADFNIPMEPEVKDYIKNMDITPEDILENAHRIYEFMQEGGLDSDSLYREELFTWASVELAIDYDILYYAWLNS